MPSSAGMKPNDWYSGKQLIWSAYCLGSSAMPALATACNCAKSGIWATASPRYFRIVSAKAGGASSVASAFRFNPMPK
jgi:hypothetical protein